MSLWLPALLALLAAGQAEAAMGLAEIPGRAGDGAVTVFYPSDAAAEPVRRGPFVFEAAPQAAPVRGNARLVVISHGSGGGPWVHTDLARDLVAAGFVVAMPEHHADNQRDGSNPAPTAGRCARPRSRGRSTRWRPMRASRRCSRSTASACTACRPAVTPR